LVRAAFASAAETSCHHPLSRSADLPCSLVRHLVRGHSLAGDGFSEVAPDGCAGHWLTFSMGHVP
jgi:hypothetical protein